MINLLHQLTGRLTGPQAKRALVASFVVGALAVPFVIPPQSAQAQNPQQGNPYTLAGTWRIDLPPSGPFPAVITFETFTEAGGSVEIDHGPGGPCAAIGTWTRVGPGEFLATLHKQLFRPATAGPFPFEPIGTVKIRRLITLGPDGNELTGIGTVNRFDQAGNPIPGSGNTSPFQGTRVVVEPPDL